MSVLELPVWVVEEIDKFRRNFFWKGGAQNERKIHLANWPMLCRPKKIGGLGILDIKVFNQAILSKWYWQWHSKQEKMWKRLFRVLYCMQGGQGVYQSFLFKTHLKHVIKFCDCFIQKIQGQGDSISLWEHDWGIGRLKYKLNILYTFTLQKDITLRQFHLLQDISDLFRPVLSEEAQQQYPTLEGIRDQHHRANLTIPDDAIWKGTEQGEFTVQSAYYNLKNVPTINSPVHKIWKLKAPPRFKIFAWMLIHNKVLTAENLKKRGYNLAGICYMCRQQDETIQHLFNRCTHTIHIYTGALHNGRGYRQGQDNIALMQEGTTKKDRELILIASFIIWRERCCRIFRGEAKTSEELIQQTLQQWTVSNQQHIRRTQQLGDSS